MQYPKSVAITWQTTFDQLGESAKYLLQRLAWISPAPIPESLLDVPIADCESEFDQFTALTELESYSLVTRATDSASFSVHRLVLEVTRRQHEDPEHTCLTEALRWIDAAFVGNPDDVRDWPTLNPLLPHARVVIERADAAGIAVPTTRLMNQLCVMYWAKSLYTEAESLMRRALVIDEASFGPEHPRIAIELNNLATLLNDTNRLAEAEPLMRRALVINESSFGGDHPNVARNLNNLAALLQATNRLVEAEPLMRRALVILIKSLGAEHPKYTTTIDNYIALLQELGRMESEIKANLADLFS